MQMTEEEYENAMLEAFVNKPEKVFWYQQVFTKFNVNGVDSMQWVWSWWAFFGGWAFLLYRKQYLPALVLFLITIPASAVPFGGLLVALFAGGFATYFVYKGYKQKKAEIENSISNPQTRIETMQKIGGYNQWVIWVYILFVTLLFVYIISATLSISNLN